MESKDKLLKRIADLFLSFVALLGLLALYPKKIDMNLILIVSVGLLFILFIILIVSHTSKLEDKINKLEYSLNIERRFAEIERRLGDKK